eukprot:scaffold35950_cov19-Tisochrysis_lutea.AAC.2
MRLYSPFSAERNLGSWLQGRRQSGPLALSIFHQMYSVTQRDRPTPISSQGPATIWAPRTNRGIPAAARTALQQSGLPASTAKRI